MEDVRLSFRGNSIANNSIVLLSDIGDNMDSRIQCITTNPDCCTRTLGFWLFPSGRQVDGRGSGDVIYRSRSRAEPTNLASVSLGRRDNMNTSGLTGLYHCVIPDRSGVDQTLIVGIYSSRENSELNISNSSIFVAT